MVKVNNYVKQGNKTSLWTAYKKIVSNHEMMKVEIEMLELELKKPHATTEKIKNIIKGIELWASAIPDNIGELDRARLDFRNRKMIEELDETKGRNDLSALFG